jgi:tRNA(Ile)-lysidine synthase
MASSGNRSVSAADGAAPVSVAEARNFFNFLSSCPAAVLAVSGGPDSTALLVLAARWRRNLKRGPKLTAITIDHGLRAEARREAADVRRLARKLGIAHRTLRWTGRKPKTGLQEAARAARYRLLAQAARKAGARHVFTGHTRDDQAETVLMRFLRGSGLKGLAGMRSLESLPGHEDLLLVRPFLHIPKARLVATLAQARIAYAEDPSNRDPRFARSRLRRVMSALGREGLTADRLVRLSERALRADSAIANAVSAARNRLALEPWPQDSPVKFEAHAYFHLEAEVALRLLGMAIERVGHEGPVKLRKLEAMYADLCRPLLAYTQNSHSAPFRRTLAGAVVTFKGGEIVVEPAPTRRGASKRP